MRPQENSMARAAYMPDISEVRELVQIISILPPGDRREVKGFALARMGMAAQGRDYSPPPNKPAVAMAAHRG